MRKLLFLFLFLPHSLFLFGQNSIPSWVRLDTMPGSSEWIYGGSQMPDGGFILGGWISSPTITYSDPLIIRTNASGDTLWERSYPGPGGDYFFDIAPTPDNGFIAAGGAGLNNVFKLDSAGNIVFSRYYPGYYFYDLMVMPDSGFVFAGYYGAIPNCSDVGIVRTDKNGDTLWTRKFGTSQYEDLVRSVKLTADGNLILAGHANFVFYADGPYNPAQAWIMKVDAANGNIIWDDYLPYSLYWRSDGVDVIENRNGDFVMCGWSSSYSSYIASFSQSGTMLWSHEYTNPANPNLSFVFRSLQQKCDDGYVICGYRSISYYDPYCAMIALTDANGDTTQTSSICGPGSRDLFRLINTDDGGFFAFGYAYDTALANYQVDPVLVKLDGQGGFGNQPVITSSFTSSVNGNTVSFSNTSGNSSSSYWDFGDGNFSSTQNPSHSYLAAGTYFVCLTSGNFCDTASYCDSVWVPLTTSVNGLQNEFSIDVFPQPVTDRKLRLLVTSSHDETLSFELLDITGRIVGPSKQLQTITGKNLFDMDLQDVSPGVYLLQLSNGVNSCTKQIVVQ